MFQIPQQRTGMGRPNSKKEKKYYRKLVKNQEKRMVNQMYEKEANTSDSNVSDDKKREVLQKVREHNKKMEKVLFAFMYASVFQLFVWWLLRIVNIHQVDSGIKLVFSMLSVLLILFLASFVVGPVLKYQLIDRQTNKKLYIPLSLFEHPPRLLLFTMSIMHAAWVFSAWLDDGKALDQYFAEGNQQRKVLPLLLNIGVPFVLGMVVTCLTAFGFHTLCISKWKRLNESKKSYYIYGIRNCGVHLLYFHTIF